MLNKVYVRTHISPHSSTSTQPLLKWNTFFSDRYCSAVVQMNCVSGFYWKIKAKKRTSISSYCHLFLCHFCKEKIRPTLPEIIKKDWYVDWYNFDCKAVNFWSLRNNILKNENKIWYHENKNLIATFLLVFSHYSNPLNNSVIRPDFLLRDGFSRFVWKNRYLKILQNHKIIFCEFYKLHTISVNYCVDRYHEWYLHNIDSFHSQFTPLNFFSNRANSNSIITQRMIYES